MNIGKLRKQIKDLPDEAPCAAEVWLPGDIEDMFEGELPDGSPMTRAEAEEALGSMAGRLACRGLNYEFARASLPDSVSERLIS